MPDRELVPTQSAFLELKAERAGMQEGYRFLDEKRLILAAEILANLKDYDATRARWRRLEASAREALRAAVGRHGLDELSIYPPAAADCRLATQRRSVLGVRIEALPPADPETADAPAATAPDAPDAAGHGPSRPNPPANQSPEADVCRAAFADLLPVAARLAVLTGNLERLRGEYVRTSRRARALEDVLLPEMDARLAAIDNALEELEREEAVRVRRPRS